jgi:hypothetical protein
MYTLLFFIEWRFSMFIIYIMRKTKTKTYRKPSGATRKKRGGATSSRVQYRIRTVSANRADVVHEANLSHHAYDTITQRIDGTLNVGAIHDYVFRHPELQGGLDTARDPRGTNHTVNHEGTLRTIVATYPRSQVHRSSSPPLRAQPTILPPRSSSRSRSRSRNPASDSDSDSD